MSIIYTELENPPKFKPTPRIRVTIDPKTTDQLPFPSDYKYYSCVLQRKFLTFADRIKNFEVRPDDIWLVEFPKSGITWTQNIVRQLKIKCMTFSDYYDDPRENAFDLPFLYDLDGDEADEKVRSIVSKWEKMFDELDEAASPRMIKSHLPAYLLPKQVWTLQPKLIYISRNPKDAACSYYHMSLHADMVTYAPYHQHLASYQQLRHLKHLLLLTYEEMSANKFESVKKVSEFLDCSYSDGQLQQLVEFSSFEKMRERVGYAIKNTDFKFCRKGKVGGYRNDMSEEEIEKFDKWIAKNKRELNLM